MRLISSYQKKILIFAMAAALGLALFWVLVYLPSGNKIAKLKDEVVSLDRSIKRVDDLSKQLRTKQTSKKMLFDKAGKLRGRLFTKEAASLKLIQDFAKSFNLETISFTPAPKRPLLDDEGKRILVEGKTCEVTSVSVKMKCYYRDFALYVDFLDRKIPSFVMIQKLIIKREHPISLRLNVDMDFDIYSLS
ncbi:MAG: hypothetical protein KJ880_07145 [Candidatus Omnitrophica bacterium]|nr:hypothetical protein [Candidatus Omnitrophota bacterium]MBU1869233.1 hypothetical protein [Candidatus Omnitrophota bacterium]